MRTLTTKRTALNRAVLKSLTGKTVKELFIQVLPALAAAGLVLPSISMAEDYDFNASYGVGEIVANVVTAGTESAIGTEIATDTRIFGMQGYDINVEDADVNIKNSTLASVYGGYTDESGAATNNTLTIDTSEIVGNVVAGVTLKDGLVDGNTVTLTDSAVSNESASEGAAVVGGVSAGDGSVTNNTVTITGGSVDGSIAGGYVYGSGSGEVSGNSVSLTGVTITVEGSIENSDFVVGGYSTGTGSITGNKVVMSGGSTEGSLVGGFSESKNSTGEVSGNYVEITNGAKIEGTVYGGDSEGNGDVSSNTIVADSSEINGPIVAGVAIGDGTVSRNTLTLTNTTVSNSESEEGAGVVGGVSTGNGDVTGNTVTISGGEIYGSITAGIAFGGNGDVSGNTVTLTDATITVVGSMETSDFVAGGYSTGTGSVKNNGVVVSGGEITGTIIGGYSESEDSTAEVSGNSVEVSNGATITNGNVIGGYSVGTGAVSGNTVTIDSSTVTCDDSADSCGIGGGVSEGKGDVSGNSITLTNTSVSGLDTILGGAIDDGYGTVENNTVTITFEETGEITAGAIGGGFTGGDGDVTGNSVTIENATVTGAISGGSSQGDGDVTGNSVTLTNVTFEDAENPIVAALTTGDGNVVNNSLTIDGGEITGVVVAGVAGGEGNVLSNTLTIKNATVTIIPDEEEDYPLAAGFTEGEGNLTENTVTISNSTINGDVSAAVSYAASEEEGTLVGGDVTGNTLTISDGSTINGSVSAGLATGDGEVSGNTLTIENSTVVAESTGEDDSFVTAGTSSGYGLVSGNTLILTNSDITVSSEDDAYVAAGYTSYLGEVSDNRVIMSGGSVEGDIYAGYSEAMYTESDVTGNVIEVSDSATIEGNVYGGYAYYSNGSVSDNQIAMVDVTVEGNVIAGVNEGETGTGNVSGNTISITNGDITGAVIGGLTSGAGDVSSNSVALTNTTVTPSESSEDENIVAGGMSLGTGSVKNNTVVISGGEINETVYGGYSEDGEGEVSGNTVTITNTDVTGGVTGGATDGAGDVTDNTVTITGGTITGAVGGGLSTYEEGEGNVSGNTVTIDSATVEGGIIGGGGNGNQTISENTVTITNSTVTAEDIFVAGGYADGSGDVTGNTVNITDSTISGEVYAGISDGGTVSNNTINVSGSSTDLTNAYLYGRDDDSSGSGNTLNISSYSGSIQNIANFDAINIDLAGTELDSSTPVITLTDSNGEGTDLSNSTITVTSSASSGGIANAVATSSALADTYAIIANANGDLTLDGATLSGTVNVVQGSSLYAEYTLDSSDGSISLAQSSEIKTTPAVSILPIQHLAIASFLNTATDFVLDRKIECTADDNGAVGTCFFGAVSGGQQRQKLHGDGITRTVGTHWFLGVQTKFNNDTSKDIIGAIWAEAGWGTVKAATSSASSRGHDNYYGLGIRGEHRQKEGALAGAYAQVFAHAGSAGYDIKSSLNNISYDKNSMYVGAGIQLGYEFPFNDSLSLDTSVKYRWLHLEGFKTTSNSLKYKVKDVDSHRTRVGTRISYGKDKSISSVYAGVAWEQEYSGRAKGSVSGISMDGTRSLKGSSAVIEAGARFKPSKKSRWSFDGSIEGYVGKREGVLGNVVVNYTF